MWLYQILCRGLSRPSLQTRAAAGLATGFLGLDATHLEVLRRSGSEAQQRMALRLQALLSRHNLVLYSVVLLHAIADEALPLVLERAFNEYVAVALSVPLVLLFGEVLPSAVFASKTGNDGAASLTATLAPLMWACVALVGIITFPLSWAVSHCWCLTKKHKVAAGGGNHHHGHGLRAYRRHELAAFLQIHADDEGDVENVRRASAYQGGVSEDAAADSLSAYSGAGRDRAASAQSGGSDFRAPLLSHNYLEATDALTTQESGSRPVYIPMSSISPLGRLPGGSSKSELERPLSSASTSADLRQIDDISNAQRKKDSPQSVTAGNVSVTQALDRAQRPPERDELDIPNAPVSLAGVLPRSTTDVNDASAPCDSNTAAAAMTSANPLEVSETHTCAPSVGSFDAAEPSLSTSIMPVHHSGSSASLLSRIVSPTMKFWRSAAPWRKVTPRRDSGAPELADSAAYLASASEAESITGRAPHAVHQSGLMHAHSRHASHAHVAVLDLHHRPLPHPHHAAIGSSSEGGDTSRHAHHASHAHDSRTASAQHHASHGHAHGSDSDAGSTAKMDDRGGSLTRSELSLLEGTLGLMVRAHCEGIMVC